MDHGYMGGWDWSIPEAGHQVMEKDGSFQPGQIQARAQPLPTTKRGEAAGARVILLFIIKLLTKLTHYEVSKNQITIIVSFHK